MPGCAHDFHKHWGQKAVLMFFYHSSLLPFFLFSRIPFLSPSHWTFIYQVPATHKAQWCSGGSLVAKSCPTLATPWTAARQASLSMGFSRQEYWSGLPFSSPEDLPDPGIKLGFPTLQADSLPTELCGKPQKPSGGCGHWSHYLSCAKCALYHLS